MVERNDPGRAGVKAGRLVGLLTAILAVASLFRSRESFYEGWTVLFELLGLDPGHLVVAIFAGNVVVAAAARYAIGYVVGSLVGVCYDWLDRPPLPVLVGIVLVVGVVDGFLAAADTQSPAIGAAYVVAWLCYVPAFRRLYDPDAGRTGTEPLRLD